MIINLSKNKTQEIIEALQSSRFQFYLTGSRFFGTEDENSDFDYFVQNSSEIEAELRELGFSPINRGLYTDSSIVGLYINENVHVQVVHNAPMKNKIQEVLKKSCGFNWMNKLTQSTCWDLCFRIAEAFEKK